MHRHIAISILLTVVVSFCLSQSDEEKEVVIKQILSASQSSSLLKFGEMNRATVTQIGDQNLSLVEQTNVGLSGLTNVLSLTQQGGFNRGVMSQTGSGNTSTAEQYGYLNDYELHLVGENLATYISQHGMGNTLTQTVKGEGLSYAISQQGNYNSFVQIENGERARTYRVSQVGDGIRTIIVNGFFPR